MISYSHYCLKLMGLLTTPVLFLGMLGINLAECRSRDCGHAIDKLCLEQDIGVGEHTILQRHHNKLEGESNKNNK